jgi:CBS domain-containing protein
MTTRQEVTVLCCEVMKSPVLSCGPDDTVATCAKLMAGRDVGFVPVLDRTGFPQGVVTDRDLAIRVVAEERSAETPVRLVMTQDIVSCLLTDPLEVAEERMADQRKSRLLVLDETGRCLGILSLSDVVRTESRGRSGRLLAAVTGGRRGRQRAEAV